MIIHENYEAIAFLDINPRSKGHTLIVTKEHIESLKDLKLDSRIMEFISVVVRRIYDKLNAEGISLVLNENEVAGSRVRHLTFHIIPRYDDDLKGIPAGAIFKPIEMKEEELKDIWKKLRMDVRFLEEEKKEEEKKENNDEKIKEVEEKNEKRRFRSKIEFY